MHYLIAVSEQMILKQDVTVLLLPWVHVCLRPCVLRQQPVEDGSAIIITVTM